MGLQHFCTGKPACFISCALARARLSLRCPDASLRRAVRLRARNETGVARTPPILRPVILTYMPPIWDSAFRPRFYERWGQESAVISARTRHAEYPEFQQLLSVKCAWGGAEEYFVDGQRIAVDDDAFLILNAGRTYASSLKAKEDGERIHGLVRLQ